VNPETTAAPLAAGTRIDGLVIERLLAQGQNSSSYAASDPAIGRRFVLREYLPAGRTRRHQDGSLEALEPGQASEWQRGLAAFRDRARQLAAIEHPGLGAVLRLVEANGTAYMLMPLYAGADLLQAATGAETLQPATARRWVLALMDALQHLHEQGLVHGAISPAQARVADAGQAILLPGGGPADADLAYAAPEALTAAGQAAPQGSGSAGDLYALAASLYHAFTGQLPASAAARAAALAAGHADPLVPAGQYLPIARYGGLADAIDQGLAISPEQRPSSAAHWRKAFASIDWRLSAVQGTATEVAEEKRDWLPFAIIGGVVALIAALSLYLLGGGSLALPGAGTPTAAPGSQQQAPAERARPANEAERRAWQAALQADTLLGYRRFIEAWPDSVYREQAEVQINILDEQAWEKLSAEDTRPAYVDYLEEFPNGLHQAAALRRIEQIDAAAAAAERARQERERLDNEAWNEARDERSMASMQRYIDAWPAGLHIDEAQRIYRQLADRRNDDQAFASAQKLDNRDAYQSYLDAFPQGAHVTAALQAVDDLTLRPGKTFRDCPQCPEMVVVPPGTFSQGAAPDDPLATPLEQPRRQVAIGQRFAAGIYEVSMAEWDACVAAGACTAQPVDNGWGRATRPVMMVSWNDALQYIGWLGKLTGHRYRLPSESEWEYMARAGTTGNWLFDDPALVCEFGNVAGRETDFQWRHEDCADPVALGTLPAGTLRPNDFGLFDVIGNVAEWTSDCMNLSYLDAPSDGRAWTRGLCSSHMARGGSWVTGTRDIRLPARFHLKSGDKNDFTGFRVVRSIDD
jgi:formylglycine-generating enzyme required for sulfatase activity